MTAPKRTGHQGGKHKPKVHARQTTNTRMTACGRSLDQYDLPIGEIPTCVACLRILADGELSITGTRDERHPWKNRDHQRKGARP